MQLKAEKNEIQFFLRKSLSFSTFKFFQKRLIRFVNGLKMNGFCRSVTEFCLALAKRQGAHGSPGVTCQKNRFFYSKFV